MVEDDPFSDWSELVHKPVYSIDGKKLGFLLKIISEYIIVGRGLINLTKYFIPKSLAESTSKKGIRLKITAYEAHSKYSYAKMKNVVTTFELLPNSATDHRVFYDRFQTLRYSTTRNRLAAAIGFISGILFLISGYKANLAIYHLLREEIVIYTARDLLTYALIPVGILAILSQLGGVAVLMGAGLFAINRVNLGKFLVMIGTGQGLFTIGLRILSELWSGRLALENNYVTWLTSSAAGLGILFALVSQSISKGKCDSVISKAIRFALRRKK